MAAAVASESSNTASHPCNPPPTIDSGQNTTPNYKSRILQWRARAGSKINNNNRSLDIESRSKEIHKGQRKHSGNIFPSPLPLVLPPDNDDGHNIHGSFQNIQRRRQVLYQARALSVQSPAAAAIVQNQNFREGWRQQRQHSLPGPQRYQPQQLQQQQQQLQPQVSPQQQRGIILASAKRHKLRRQVTICEDSISIPDSQLLTHTQGCGTHSHSSNHSSVYSLCNNDHNNIILPPHPPFINNNNSDNNIRVESSRSFSPMTSSPSVIVTSSSLAAARGASPVQLVLPGKALTSSPSSSSSPAKITRQESSFTQEEIHSLHEAFAQLDSDGNGKLSRKEAEAALGQVLSPADLHYFLLDMRTDENGEVEWKEFLHAMKVRMREPESVKMLKEAFRVVADDPIDSSSNDLSHHNGGGSHLTISSVKMKHWLMFSETRSTEQEVEEMLKVLDLDGDGMVDMEDFVRLLVREQQQQKEGGSSPDSEQESNNKCCIL